MYGFAHAERSIVIHQRWKDGAVGGTRATSLAEVDVARMVGIVGDHHDVIITRLGRGGNVTGLRGIGGIAATDPFRQSQAVGARSYGIVERSPATKIDVLFRGAVHVNRHAARVGDFHIIPCGIRR